MQQGTSNQRLWFWCAAFLWASCNQPAATTKEPTENAATTSAATAETATALAYDPAMDPFLTSGESIKKLGDTLGIKMYEFTAKPGDSWKMHTHPVHTAYVLQGGKMALYIKETGKQDTLEFATGMSLISGSLSDSGKNIGTTTIKMLVTDIYRPLNK